MGTRFNICVDGLMIVGEIYYPLKGQEPFPTLCLCHGIPAVPPDPSDKGYTLLAEQFAEEGFLTCIFNFRGAGESEGNLDLLGWTHDLSAVITYLTHLDAADPSEIALMGFSGGAATAAYVTAYDTRISTLITCACPAEFSKLTTGQGLEAFLDQCRTVGTIKDETFPPSIEEWGAHFQQVSPIEFIDQVSPRPLLIIHGENDELIDPAHAHSLYEKAREPKELVMIPHGEHRLRTNKTAIAAALSWLKKVTNRDN